MGVHENKRGKNILKLNIDITDFGVYSSYVVVFQSLKSFIQCSLSLLFIPNILCAYFVCRYISGQLFIPYLDTCNLVYTDQHMFNQFLLFKTMSHKIQGQRAIQNQQNQQYNFPSTFAGTIGLINKALHQIFAQKIREYS